MQSHCFVSFEDRGKDHEPRSASYATIEAGKVISLWRECSLASPRFGARESDFRLVTSRNVREKMSPVLTHWACVLNHISQLFVTPEEPIGSSVLGILQARILEWVAVPSSKGSFRPRD